MTRFTQEISGALGDFWKKNAEREVADLMNRLDQIEIEDDGAARWKKSGNYLPREVCEKLSYGGAPLSIEATAVKREAQTAEFLAGYFHETTEEEKHAMRAAFGEGTTVVDIITGERIAV